MLCKGYKVVSLTYVGAMAADKYIQERLNSGVCILVSAILVVSAKTKWAGKSHYASALGLGHHFDDAEDVVQEYCRWGQPVTQVDYHARLSDLDVGIILQ